VSAVSSEYWPFPKFLIVYLPNASPLILGLQTTLRVGGKYATGWLGIEHFPIRAPKVENALFSYPFEDNSFEHSLVNTLSPAYARTPLCSRCRNLRRSHSTTRRKN
jgi:hypothetical protein